MKKRLTATLVLTFSATLLPSAVAGAESCGGQAYAPPFTRGPLSEENCAVFGSPGLRVHYSWSVAAGGSTSACLDGWGYEHGNPANGRWFPLGCGSTGTADVPWGNVAATPKVRAQSQKGGAFPVYWETCCR